MKYWAAFAVISIALVISLYFIKQQTINSWSKNLYLATTLGFVLLVLNYEFSMTSFRLIVNILIYILISLAHLKIVLYLVWL